MDGQGTKRRRKKTPKISTGELCRVHERYTRQTTDRRNGDSIANVKILKLSCILIILKLKFVLLEILKHYKYYRATFTFARPYMLSPVRLSVVCNVRAPHSAAAPAPEINNWGC